MICVSLKKTEPEKLRKVLRRIEFAEIRMDDQKWDASAVRELFSVHPKLIATCRPGSLDNTERMNLLLWAIQAGAAYVDIEIESEKAFINGLAREARRHGCGVILSYHNEEYTPERIELQRIVSRCYSCGADIAKIACRVRAQKDNARLLGLLDSEKSIVVVGMGKMGRITRVLAPSLGSPFTYACLGEKQETAAGQIGYRRLSKYMNRVSDV